MAAGASERVEVREGQRARQLAGPIGAEVEVEGRVFGFDAVVVADDEGLDELVGLSGREAPVDALPGRRGAGAVGFGDDAVRPLHALPAVVAIHRPVPARDGADHAGPTRELLLERGDVPRRRSGLHVAAVEERVDDDGHAGAPGEIDECQQVSERRVDAAVAHEAEEVQAPTRLLGLGDDVDEHGVLAQRLDRELRCRCCEMSIIAMRPAPMFR